MRQAVTVAREEVREEQVATLQPPDPPPPPRDMGRLLVVLAKIII